MEKNDRDKEAIIGALEKYYFKGIFEGNLDLLHHILNPGTLLFGDVKGQPYAKTLDQYLEGVRNRQSPKDLDKPFKGNILDVKVVNSIAVAEVKVRMYDFHYHEFLSLHRFKDEWRIVNKMLTDTLQ